MRLFEKKFFETSRKSNGEKEMKSHLVPTTVVKKTLIIITLITFILAVLVVV